MVGRWAGFFLRRQRAGNRVEATPVLAEALEPRALLAVMAPGEFQVEDYDRGASGLVYYDTSRGNQGKAYRPKDHVDIYSTGDGYAVSWTKKGEWLRYTLYATASMTYAVNVRVSSAFAGGKFHIVVDGKSLTRPVTVPVTGRSGWTDVSAGTVNLKAGRHTVRLVMDSIASNGYTGRFDTISFTVPKLDAPTNLKASAVSGSTIRLSWQDNTANELGYFVERSTQAYGPWERIAVLAPNATSATDTGVVADTEYYYRVQAAGATVVSDWSNIASEMAQFGTPIVITSGGTYTGTWESLDPDTPAVSIETDEPVIIENAVIRSWGHLIEASGGYSNVTVRNTRGYGMTPYVEDRHAGRFFTVDHYVSVTLENNYLEGTSGIYVSNYQGDNTVNQTVKVLRNVARNIDGRARDGEGFVPASELVQFVQIAKSPDLRGAEIAWNEVINTPDQSLVEDNINIFESSGTYDSPLLIHDNYIQGAYPIDPANNDDYSGGGILLSDYGSSWVRAYNNTILDTTNYGIAISSGHNNEFYNNRILSSGLLPSGARVAAQNVGVYIWNYDGDPGFISNIGWGNQVGWMRAGQRNDAWTPDWPGWSSSQSLASGTITRAMVNAEWPVWQSRLTYAGILVGPI